MKYEQIEKILKNSSKTTSKWELDNIIYYDRTSNPVTLIKFLTRIQNLKNSERLLDSEKEELDKLLDLLSELDYKECLEVINNTEEESKDAFIENLARTSAIEILTKGRIEKETMETACRLSPSDFILSAKRTQDLINAIQSLVIKGENLSNDVAGA